MPDMTLKCNDCGADFIFTEKEQKFFESKAFKPPKRCKPCRDAKKQATRTQGN
jgi:hypothetical protein